MRGRNTLGRFDPELEVKSIRHGVTQDLQAPVGQFVGWRVFNPEATVTDEIYDVGSSTGGRVFNRAINMPVVNAYVYQNELFQNDRGFYTVDTLRLWVNYDDIVRFLPTLDADPDRHLKDRVEFRGQMYVPTRVFPRGQINMDYMMLMVDLSQVKPEEQVNDIYES